MCLLDIQHVHVHLQVVYIQYMSCCFIIGHCIKLNSTAGGARLLNSVRCAVALVFLEQSAGLLLIDIGLST